MAARRAVPPFRKTRLAPTPSGLLHLGNAFSFLLTHTLARQANAALLLRIDDLDRQRHRPAYVADVFQTLSFLNIPWQEGPADALDFEAHWSQVHRLPLYQNALDALRAADAVFACACSRMVSVCPCFGKNLPLDAPGMAWRLKTNGGEKLALRNLWDEPHTAPLPPGMHRFLVRRKDGLPAYQVASVVDDLHFGVDCIVRGADLWPSTLAQQALALRLGQTRFSEIRFCHHPLLRDAAGGKLSKSAGAASIEQTRPSSKAALLAQVGALLPGGPAIETETDLLLFLDGGAVC